MSSVRWTPKTIHFQNQWYDGGLGLLQGHQKTRLGGISCSEGISRLKYAKFIN